MKRLKKGPELKMSDLKVPDFLKDVFYDLHDRRLLAPLLLVVVAIAAVPFLLGGDSADPAPATGAATPTAEPAATESASFTVVEAKPGLRDYRKRLAGRNPTNPFKQRYTSASVEGAKLDQGDESSSTAGTVTTSSMEGSTATTASSAGPSTVPSAAAPPPPGSPPVPLPGDGDDGDHHRLTYYTFGIKVRIVKSGGQEPAPKKDQEPVIKEGVLPLTPLPGVKAPVVTYMGAPKGEVALLMVSNEVKGVSGPARCASAEEVCQLLAVEPGVPLTFVYGYNETRYTIKVLKIDPVVTGHG